MYLLGLAVSSTGMYMYDLAFGWKIKEGGLLILPKHTSDCIPTCNLASGGVLDPLKRCSPEMFCKTWLQHCCIPCSVGQLPHCVTHYGAEL